MSDDTEKPYALTSKDKERIAATVAMMKKLQDALERVMPDVDKEQIGTLAHDFGDLWEFAKVHQERAAQIIEMKGPEDRKNLAEMLDDLLYGDVLEWDITSKAFRSTSQS